MYKRILIVGDAGRGKSTFAKKLSEKTGIPSYSTDDFYWKTKFTEPNNKQTSITDIQKIYEQDEWIVDGSTRHLIIGGLEKAHIIYFLEFTHIIPQYYFLIKRFFTRKFERFSDLWALLKHITYKRYKKGYGAHLPSLREILKPYADKVVRVTSLKQLHTHLK